MRLKFSSALAALMLSSLASMSAFAQQPASKTTTAGASVTVVAQAPTVTATVAITPATSPTDLARASLIALGGDKYRNMKSMWLSGSVELFAPNSAQSLPGKFALVTSGERYRRDIQSPAFVFQQIYDGQQNYSSVPQFDFPPPSLYGLSVLNKYDRPGYTVTALPDNKKQRAFRITGPENNSTDFYIDAATARLVSYSFNYNGLTFATEFKSFKEVDGVLLPSSFVEKLDTPRGSFYADSKVKEAKVNQVVTDDVFAIPAK